MKYYSFFDSFGKNLHAEDIDGNELKRVTSNTYDKGIFLDEPAEIIRVVENGISTFFTRRWDHLDGYNAVGEYSTMNEAKKSFE